MKEVVLNFIDAINADTKVQFDAMRPKEGDC
jgi:hypothetical protein